LGVPLGEERQRELLRRIKLREEKDVTDAELLDLVAQLAPGALAA